jgi:hypothetical protein
MFITRIDVYNVSFFGINLLNDTTTNRKSEKMNEKNVQVEQDQ